MALPKGVKSGVDYRGLYSSNELEGEVLLEKEPEMPKFNKTDNPSFKKKKVDPALNKKGGLDFTDYSKLTESQVLTWVESSLTDDSVTYYKSEIEKKIEWMNDTAAGVNTEVMDAPPPLPW